MKKGKKLFDLMEDIDKYDLSDEDYNEFCNELNSLKDNKSLKDLFDFFDIDYDELLNNISDIASSIHNTENKEKTSEEKKVEIENEKKFVRPSEQLDYEHKLQLHKIVQEYIDTMVKPFNNGTLNDQQINDAYAGLYEFAAWVMNR